MSNLNINKIVQSIIEIKDRKGSTVKDLQKKLNVNNKQDIKKLNTLLSNAVSKNILTKSNKGRYKIFVQSSNQSSAQQQQSKPQSTLTGVSPEELKQLDTIHDFGHATNRNAPNGLNTIFSPINGFEAFLDNLNLGNVDSNAQLKRICSTSSENIKKRSVSYERRANAKADNCAMENAWKEGKYVTWENIILRKVDPSIIDDDILIIQNGDDYNYAFKNALRREKGLIPESSIKKMTARNIVGGFILNYMFPGYAEDNGNAPIGVTYDAAGAKITKVFSGLGQVKASITPENIADSASTMLDPFKKFKQYGHKRTDFIFPENKAGSGNWDYTSQYFSQDLFKIIVENKNFNVNNPNGFVINIYNKSDNSLIFSINYDTWVKNIPMGPSAPYLAGLIETLIKEKDNIQNAIQKIKDSPELKPKSNIIPLLPLIGVLVQRNFTAEQIITLLFDLKRTGDYEQANAAKKLLEMDPDTSIILGTGDILCSAYARSIGQPCALDGTGGAAEALILFRFPTNRPQITPEIKALKEIRKNIKFCIDNYQIVTNLQALTQKVQEIKNSFDMASQNGKYIVDDPTNNLRQHEISTISYFFTIILRLHCYNISEKISQVTLSDNSTTEIMQLQQLKNLENQVNIFIQNSKELTSEQIQKNNQYQLLSQINVSDMINRINNSINGDDDSIISKISEFSQKGIEFSILDSNNNFKSLNKKEIPFYLLIGYDITSISKIESKMQNFFIRMPKTPKPLERYIIRYYSGRNVLDNLNNILKSQSEKLSEFIGTLRNVMDDNSIVAQNELKQGESKTEVMNDYKGEILIQIKTIDKILPLQLKHLTFITPTPTPNVNDDNSDINDVIMSGGDMDDIINFKNNLYESLEIISSKCNEFLIDKVNDYFSTLSDTENTQKMVYQLYSILFNFYKILNRYLNACRTISDQNGNIYLTLTSTRDLNTSLITLSQQIMYYSSKFGTNTNITNNQIANNKIKTILNWVVSNTPYIQNPGSRGRRRAAIQTEIVKLMKALSIQASTITPSSSLEILKQLQILLGGLLKTPLNNSEINLTQIFINIHQIVNNGSEDFKEEIMLSWSDTLTYELEDAKSISYSITDNGEIVYPKITTSNLAYVNAISVNIMNMNKNNVFISTFATLNNIFQTTSITFDPITSLSPNVFQQMGFTINTPNINGVNYNILTGKLDVDTAPFKLLENVNEMINSAFQNTGRNISEKSQSYVTSLNNGSILFDPLIVDVPDSVFTNANYFGSVNDPLSLYVYPPRLGQYKIPDSNNFSWNMTSPLPKNTLLQGGKRKTKKSEKKKKENTQEAFKKSFTKRGR